ncbi:MAG: hypothetical protein NTZ67_00990 [Gammaproteobacteria bacterium]|nr:hypothetical protein [Gammaproteobacteria bacterium]
MRKKENGVLFNAATMGVFCGLTTGALTLLMSTLYPDVVSKEDPYTAIQLTSGITFFFAATISIGHRTLKEVSEFLLENKL